MIFAGREIFQNMEGSVAIESRECPRKDKQRRGEQTNGALQKLGTGGKGERKEGRGGGRGIGGVEDWWFYASCIFTLTYQPRKMTKPGRARVVQIARTVFMQMPAHSCCTLRHFPYRRSSPSKLTSLVVSLSISRFHVEGEGKTRRGRKVGNRGEGKQGRGKMARQETRRNNARGLLRFISLICRYNRYSLCS